MSTFAGLVASFIGNPSDLALVRFQSDSYLPMEERRNYRNVFHAFYRIIKEEGAMTLWRGSMPTICRGVSMNVGMMASYDEFKERLSAKLHKEKEHVEIRLFSSALSGMVCAIISLPFDNVKTKI